MKNIEWDLVMMFVGISMMFVGMSMMAYALWYL